MPPPPNRDAAAYLAAYIELGTFTAVAERFGVTANTVSHWCKKLDLTTVRAVQAREAAITPAPTRLTRRKVVSRGEYHYLCCGHWRRRRAIETHLRRKHALAVTVIAALCRHALVAPPVLSVVGDTPAPARQTTQCVLCKAALHTAWEREQRLCPACQQPPPLVLRPPHLCVSPLAD